MVSSAEKNLLMVPAPLELPSLPCDLVMLPAFQIWCERHGTVAQGPVSQSTASKTVAEPEVGTA